MSTPTGSPSVRTPNSTDVARLAGVSRATVSYVFNGRRNGATVPEPTRERILAVAESIGYRPNRTARALKTGKTNTIALWSVSFGTPYHASVLGHVQSLARADGYEVVVISGGSREALYSSLWAVDGAIMIDKVVAIADWDRVSRPVISMGAYFDRSVDHVGIDLYAGTKMALAHLEARGKKRVAYLTWEWVAPDVEWGRDARLAAYAETLGMRGDTPEWIRATGSGRRGAYNTLRNYWMTKPEQERPDALLCLDDLLAIGALAFLRDSGVRVPKTVAVIGCDGIEEGEFYTPSLTTLIQPVADASRLAWQFLRQRLAEPDTAPQSVILTPSLAIRESS